MHEALQYPFFQRALAAGLLASVACGVIGSYVVVKRIASISGGLSHAAFGGVGLGYLLGFHPMLGAAGFALLSALGLGTARQRRSASLDTLVSMVWATGMALGVVFVSLRGGYAPDLMSYLFGSILLVPAPYVLIVAALDVLILATVALLFRHFRAVSFDEEFALVMGVRVEWILQILLVLVALAVVTLIRVVGTILVIALLTIPAATARRWTDGLLPMMGLATLLGAGCTTAGLFLSYELSSRLDVNVPTGPLIVLLAALAYGVSVIVRGSRGA